MKILCAAGLLICLGLAGCSHTARGIQQDTKQDEPAVAHALQRAGNAAATVSQKAAKGIEKEAGKASQPHHRAGDDPPAKS